MHNFLKQFKKGSSTIILAIIFAIMSMGFTGCSKKHVDFAIDTAEVNVEYNDVMSQYSLLKSIATSKKEQLPEDDQKAIKQIDTNVELIKSKVDTLRSKDFYNVSLSEIGYLHVLAKDSYHTGKDIYLRNQGALSVYEKEVIKMYDKKLLELNADVEALQADPENADILGTLSKALTIVALGMKLAVPLIL